MAKNLTDREIKYSLKPKEKPYERMEDDGFGLRVLPGGSKSFILQKRYPGSKNPARRLLGHYPAMSLEEAHKKAAKWRDLIAHGIDPAIEEKRLQEAVIAAERAKQAATFSAVFEVYSRRKLARLRSGRTTGNEMRRELAAWMDRPIADIAGRDVKAMILAIADRGHEAQAHQIFSYVRAFFAWVCDDDEYGVEDSPCLKLKPARLIGKRNVGKRVLRDVEIAALWRAADAMGFPDGSYFKLLLLSGVRRTEAARLQWQEIDSKDGVLVIPSERMKNGEPHLVTLVPEIRALLDSLPPRGRGGDFIFSTTGGHLPVVSFSRIKEKLDALMKADLEAQGLEFEPFVIHDIRRSVRTQLSKLRISGDVCEAVLAHAKTGLHKVYNLHDFQDEKAEALVLWHAKLKSIVEPEPEPEIATGNVVPLRVA